MSTRNRAFRLAGLALAALVPTAASATIPGNIEQVARSGLLHVCVDEEPGADDYIVCDEQPGGDDTAAYTGSECVAQGLPPACVIDFLPKVRLKGRLLLINDDTAYDVFANQIEAAGIVLEVKAGKRRATLVEIFNQTAIGNWNQFQESFFAGPADDPLAIEFQNDTGTAFQIVYTNLFEVGNELRDLATQWFPNEDFSQAIAVLTAIQEDKKGGRLVHDGDTLASAASFKVVIEFARVRP
jgi:hypothetical protein